ncbi:MAG: aminopeptidase [Sporomusaceae bacterium]|nr:aminopeptidase [Sporomusaceae bacterium]
MNEIYLQRYAQLIVQAGVNLQKNQTVVITTPIECASFARLIAQEAFAIGARDVVMNWKDELFAKIRYEQGPEVIFSEFPQWQQDFYLSYMKQGAAFISIAANDPTLLKDVEPKRLALAQKTSSEALREYRENMMNNRNTWTVVSVPTVSWARKVFPEDTEATAVEKLWQAIAKSVRIDCADPVAAWDHHKKQLKKRLSFLNEHQFQFLHYTNSLGTDVTIELPAHHLWLGGSELTPSGLEFMANMPTEEVFTLPKRDSVNGKVVSSRPLNYNGNLIEDFYFVFKNGKIVEAAARVGEKVLQNLIATDDGASYLGEVALVPYDSPISNMNLLFYNTLFDENASCHLAIGKAYPVCLSEGETKSRAELAAAGVNDSLIHEDFMIGTADLTITGIQADGTEIPVFKAGNFAF